jgi:hypothetical protein
MSNSNVVFYFSEDYGALMEEMEKNLSEGDDESELGRGKRVIKRKLLDDEDEKAKEAKEVAKLKKPKSKVQ